MTKISIKNFQSISSLDLDVEGFTVITGRNNIGKSAIIRSINAALTNKTGNKFIRLGEKSAAVSLKHKGLDLRWEKGDSKKGESASYRIGTESYTKLNKAIPKPIIDAGFRSIEIDDFEVNPLYAPQFKPIFLLDENGTRITEVLSAIYDLDVISRADDLCQKEIRSVKTLLKTRTSDKEALQGELEKFKDFDKVRDSVNQALELEEDCNKIRKEIEELTEYMSAIDTLKTAIKSLEPITEISLPDISDQRKSIKDYQWLIDSLKILAVVTDRLRILKPVVEIKMPDSQEHRKNVEALQVLNDWNDFLKQQVTLVKQLQGVKSALSGIGELKSTSGAMKQSIDDLFWVQTAEKAVTSMAVTVKDIKGSLEKTAQKLEGLKTEKAKFKLCPTCKRPL